MAKGKARARPEVVFADVPDPQPRECKWKTNAALDRCHDNDLVSAFLKGCSVGMDPGVVPLPGAGRQKKEKHGMAKGAIVQVWSIKISSKWRVTFHITTDTVVVSQCVASDDKRRFR
jgi:hypothetical protein